MRILTINIHWRMIQRHGDGDNGECRIHTPPFLFKKPWKNDTKTKESKTKRQQCHYFRRTCPIPGLSSLFMRFIENTKHSLTSVLFFVCAVLCCCVEFDHLFHLYSHMKLAAANYNPLFPGLSESFALIGPRWYFVRNIPRGTRAWFWEGGSVRRL